MQTCTVVKLQPSPEQHDALVKTLRTCNAACDTISAVAFETGVFRQFDLHKLVYYPLKKSTGLHANHVVRAIAKVSHAYKLDTNVQRTFSPLGAIELDDKLLVWGVPEQRVSLNTVQGRIKLDFSCSQAQKELFQGKLGQADLLFREGCFYLSVAVTVTEAFPFEPTGVIGVDLGIAKVAVDSDGHVYMGEPVKAVRKKYRRLRQKVQSKKTRSAYKKLSQVRRRESRFVKNENHCISKELVNRAKERQKALGLETLQGIRRRGNGLNRALRIELNAWSFNQLKQFVSYKALRAGVTVIEVNPRYSSQMCSACGYCDKANRKSQEKFECQRCCFQANADFNAALNLKARAEACQSAYSSAFSTR